MNILPLREFYIASELGYPGGRMRAISLVGLLLLLLMAVWAATTTACAVCDITLMASQPLGDEIPGDDPIPDSGPGSPSLLGDEIPGDDPIPDGLTPHP